MQAAVVRQGHTQDEVAWERFDKYAEDNTNRTAHVLMPLSLEALLIFPTKCPQLMRIHGPGN